MFLETIGLQTLQLTLICVFSKCLSSVVPVTVKGSRETVVDAMKLQLQRNIRRGKYFMQTSESEVQIIQVQ